MGRAKANSYPNPRQGQLRSQIAQEAARLMLEGGLRDYGAAKRKAAEKLQLADMGQLPRNEEIEAAVREYQRLFRGNRQQRHLTALRQVACEAMRFLDRFDPCLVGSVLHGTADVHSEIVLHLFAEPAEEVGLYLLDRGIPHELAESRLRAAVGEVRNYPAYRFLADKTPIELVVFHARERWHSPLSPIDGKPMRRARLSVVEGLCAAQV